LVYTKIKGVQKENVVLDVETFIAVKGFKALGNQLTTEKLKQVNLLEPLPYEEPQEESIIEMDETNQTSSDELETETDEDGQITLF